MASKGGAVFVRESTGLVKNVSLFDAIALNVRLHVDGSRPLPRRLHHGSAPLGLRGKPRLRLCHRFPDHHPPGRRLHPDVEEDVEDGRRLRLDVEVPRRTDRELNHFHGDNHGDDALPGPHRALRGLRHRFSGSLIWATGGSAASRSPGPTPLRSSRSRQQSSPP